MAYNQSKKDKQEVEDYGIGSMSLDEAIDMMQQRQSVKKLPKKNLETAASRSKMKLKEVTDQLRVAPEAEADPYDCLNANFSSKITSVNLRSSMRSLHNNLKLCDNIDQKSKKKDIQTTNLANQTSTSESQFITNLNQQRNSFITASSQQMLHRHSLLPSQNSVPNLLIPLPQYQQQLGTTKNDSIDDQDDAYYKEGPKSPSIMEPRSVKTSQVISFQQVQPTILPVNYVAAPRGLTTIGSSVSGSNGSKNFNQRSSIFCSSKYRSRKQSQTHSQDQEGSLEGEAAEGYEWEPNQQAGQILTQKEGPTKLNEATRFSNRVNQNHKKKVAIQTNKKTFLQKQQSEATKEKVLKGNKSTSALLFKNENVLMALSNQNMSKLCPKFNKSKQKFNQKSNKQLFYPKTTNCSATRDRETPGANTSEILHMSNSASQSETQQASQQILTDERLTEYETFKIISENSSTADNQNLKTVVPISKEDIAVGSTANLQNIMEARGKFGVNHSTQHQHLFKPVHHSAADKYPNKNIGASANHPNSSYNQFKLQSDSLQQVETPGTKRDSKGKPSSSTEQTGTTTLKSYSGRGLMTRVPSQIINPAAMVMRDSSGHTRLVDESYEVATKNTTAGKYKIEYQPAKNHAITRKQSKVNTLVNSLMSNSNNTTGILQQSVGPSTTKNIRAKKAHGNRTTQKSLESPMHGEPLSTKAAKAVDSLRKVGPNGVGSQAAPSHKKRFYNSMVVSGMLPKEPNQTPKLISQSSQHPKEGKYSLDQTTSDQATMQNHLYANRGANGSIQISKQLSAQNQKEHHHAQQQQSVTHGNNTPSRRKNNRPNHQKHQSQQPNTQVNANPSGYSSVQQHQYSTTQQSSTGAAVRSIGSVGQRRRTSKQMVMVNSTSQLQQSMVQSGDYQLTSVSQLQQPPYSPNKTTKLYKSTMNRNSILSGSHPQAHEGKQSYIPINSGQYVMTSNQRSETSSATGQNPEVAENAGNNNQGSTDQNIYEVTPHKKQHTTSNIYSQIVNKAGNNSVPKTTTNQNSNTMQQEYNAQVPVSSYYLLHGKYNSKGKKTQSSSAKATDLGSQTNTGQNVNSSVNGKNSLLAMQQINHQLSKPAPKSHSHGISTPTTINSHPMNGAHNIISSLAASPQNPGSVINVPKHLGQSNHSSAHQVNGMLLDHHVSGVKSHQLRDTPLSTAQRLSEGPAIYTQGASEIKTQPGSTQNSKRNSIAANILSAEKSLRGSAQTKGEVKMLRNQDQLGSKASRHKRKNAGLSNTQQNVVLSDSTQNFGKMRTSSSKQQKEKFGGVKGSNRGTAAHSNVQSMSGELIIGNNGIDAAGNMHPRSRGLMLQQSVDKPTEQQIRGDGPNGGSSVATSALTSPKLGKQGDSVNKTNSKRSQGSSSMVLREQDHHHDSMSQSKEGFILQTGPRMGSIERWALQSPSQENLAVKPKGYHLVQAAKQQQMKGGVNASSEFPNNDNLTPLKKESSVRKTMGPKREQSHGHGSLMQPRILSKTNKNSTAASKELLHPRQSQGNGGQQAQGQVLINQYVTTKKRALRRNISGDRISSIERTSQVAEQIFLQPQTTKNNNLQTSAQMKHQQQYSTNPAKVPKSSINFMKLAQHSKQPSQSSLESLQQNISPSMMSGAEASSQPYNMTQGTTSTESNERLQRRSLGANGQPSNSTPSNKGGIVPLAEEFSEHTPDAMSPRSREVALLTKVITDCFQKYNKMPKTRIELYKVGKILGKGAFGKVNLGLHRLTRRLVAIKSTDKDQIKEESTKRKMMQEIDILKAIKHTSHIKLMETFQTSKHYLIVMELCPGGDLLNYVRKRRKLSEKNAKYLFKQIMQGIAYMHTIGIVHRDIKLDNILLDGNGNVKIGDFGVSRRVEHEELLFEQCGTPAYIAPEIVQEIGYKGLPVDIWSAGVCLYAILYGNVPFKANQIGDLTHELYQQEIEYRDTVSELARDLMQNMLEKNVSKRLTAKEVLYHPWFDDVEESINIFDEQEKNLIRKEFTYILQKQKLKEHEDREPHDLNTEFTEHSIGADSACGLLKNSSTRSVILCPFNSRQADVNEQNRLPEICAPMMEDKDIMLRFGIRVRELDRAYEKFNNQDFDNGVYHKYAYKNQGGNKDGAEEEKKEEEEKADHAKKSTTRQKIMQRILQEAQIIMPERVMTPESEKYAKIDMGVVNQVTKYGFPQSTLINSLRKNLANHCTTSYFLLLMDQVF